MKLKALRALVVFFLSTLFILGSTVPAYADYNNWANPLDRPTPQAYGNNRAYTRTQWMRFYTNYWDTDQPRAGTYATPIGAYYGVVFDDLSNPDPNTGWTAIEKHPNSPPESTTAVSGDTSLWLDGYLGLNPNLEDSNYWLCSPAFLKSMTQPVNIGGFYCFVNQSWPLSQNPEGSNQKLDVQLSVGSTIPDGSKPTVTPGYDTVTNPVSIKNGPDVFRAGATNIGPGTDPSNYKTRYVWSGLASTEGTGPALIGDINLTQQAAGNAVGRVFNSPSGSTGQYMSSGYVTASFPYNIFVAGVNIVDDSGSSSLVDWNVVNQTPLWLKGITVRVYTRGKQTGSWNLVNVYPNIDMPPATTSGKIKHGSSEDTNYYTSSSRVIINSAGYWSVAKPASYTSVPKPDEGYDVIVTANVQP